MDASALQPGRWPPFVEASTHGLELIYPYETECQVISANGTVRFEWDFAREPGGEVTGGEFRAFSPLEASRYYLFNTRLDLQPPPGYVLRTEPHPRYFTDDTGTTPLSMVGHLQNEWYPRLLFVVFRAPRPGQRHIFRKGEPFVQVLFVPEHMNPEKTGTLPEEAAQHREREGALRPPRGLSPQPIRMTKGTWAGSPEKMEDGSEPQPWHCLPFVQASTYGLELLYPYETECHVVRAGDSLRFEGDFTKDPGQSGGEFRPFSLREGCPGYLFHTQIDLQPPPGHVLRIEPHPRYFTDDSATVPLPTIGHLSNAGLPPTSLVFCVPRPGERHIFRKGEPFAQVIFVPQPMTVETIPMTVEEAAQRRQLEDAIEPSRLDIADHVWHNPAGFAFNDHYKVLARAFARDGLAGVKEVVRTAIERHQRSLPSNLTVADYLAQGAQWLREQKFEQAGQLFAHVLSLEPNNAAACSWLGVCYDALGNKTNAYRAMSQAVHLNPNSANYHANLGEFLRRLGRLQEAESSFRSALFLTPADPDILSVLALTLHQQGRPAEAIQLYRAALATPAPVPQAHYGLGMILVNQGQYAEARAQFEAALTLAPNFRPAQQALGELARNWPP
jgi:Flp pilus assembly protein TadD